MADRFPEEFLPEIEKMGYQYHLRPELNGAALRDALPGMQVLLVRSTRISDDTLKSASDLTWIIRAGAGYNTIDCDAAARRAIWVSNVPGRNSIAVAELTMGLILALDRRIPENVMAIRRNQWRKKDFSRARGLLGKTLGIVGMGRIGIEVARRAHGFGLRLLAVEKTRSLEMRDQMDELGVTSVSRLEDLFAASDIVTLHVPATPATSGLISAELLSLMKPGSFLVNTSRSTVVDESALLQALDSQDLWAGVDVFADEPASADHPWSSELVMHPRVYTTHHIGASTRQAQDAIASEVVHMLADYARGQVRNVVNLGALLPRGTFVTIRHLDRVGVLSAVLTAIRSLGLNVQNMSNQVFGGAGASVAVIQVQGDVPQELVPRLESLPHIMGVAAHSTEDSG
jgi:D-3-phosphoglycerate dehydrogenase